MLLYYSSCIQSISKSWLNWGLQYCPGPPLHLSPITHPHHVPILTRLYPASTPPHLSFVWSSLYENNQLLLLLWKWISPSEGCFLMENKIKGLSSTYCVCSSEKQQKLLVFCGHKGSIFVWKWLMFLVYWSEMFRSQSKCLSTPVLLT